MLLGVNVRFALRKTAVKNEFVERAHACEHERADRHESPVELKRSRDHDEKNDSEEQMENVFGDRDSPRAEVQNLIAYGEVEKREQRDGEKKASCIRPDHARVVRTP